MTMPAGWKPSVETTVLGTERIVWHNELTKGFFHKQVVETQRITNYRVIQNNSQILLKDVDDIVVMNQHRVSQSSYMGTYTGRYTRFGYGTSRSTGVSVGDVVFMYQGRPYIIFRQITDPNGVARIPKSARKQLLAAIKTADKIQVQSQKQVARTIKRDIGENVSVNNITANKITIECPRCNSNNPKGSKYCNKCGLRIDNKATDTNRGQYNSTPVSAANALTSFGSNNNASMKQVNESGFLTYESSFYKVKIDYPPNWTKVEQGLGKPLVVAFQSPKEDAFDPLLENVSIGIVPVTVPITLDQFVQLSINDLKKAYPNVEIPESSPTTLSGTPARKIIYIRDGQTFLNLVIARPDFIYIIVYVAENYKYAVYLPIAQKIINSFEFTD